MYLTTPALPSKVLQLNIQVPLFFAGLVLFSCSKNPFQKAFQDTSFPSTGWVISRFSHNNSFQLFLVQSWARFHLGL